MKTNAGFVACPLLAFVLLMGNEEERRRMVIPAKTVADGKIPATKGDATTFDQHKTAIVISTWGKHVPVFGFM
jgi:hypothetical protein